MVLDIQPLSSVADHFLICSGSSDRQVKAIADAIREELGKQGEKPLAIEGYQEGTWILIDCVDLVIHVFDEETRHFYDLERLWGRAERVDIPGLENAPAALSSAAAPSFSKSESWCKSSCQGTQTG